MGSIPLEEMVTLFWTHDVLLYPSAGEGFGFIPLQALATGMPTICTEAWAPYQQFLGPLALDSTPGPSRWDTEHPGTVFWPDEDQLRRHIETCYNEFPAMSDYYYAQAEAVREHYDWDRLTGQAIRKIEASLP